MVSTSVASDTIDTAMVVRMASAASGPPVIQRGITSKPSARSTVIVASDNTTPATTHMTGMNHKLDRTLDVLDDALISASPCTRQQQASNSLRRW